MKALLAIDQSTSATKAILFDEIGNILDQEALPHQQIYPVPGWVEHDAKEIYQNTLQVIKTLLERNREITSQLLCVSITNQRETFVIFDRVSGEPLYHAIVWQCRRGESICNQLIKKGYADKVQRISGLKIDTYFPASKIQWLLEQQPDLKQKLIDGSALWGTIDTYLIYRLTQGQVYATDYTNASRTLFFDIQQLAWSKEMCELFGIPMKNLPEVRESDDTFGETTFEGMLQYPLPICGVMGDSQAALFAQRCYEIGSAKVTFGTGSSILLNIGKKLRISTNGVVTTIAWVYQGSPTYAFEGITNFTGATIAWLRDQVGLIKTSAESEDMAIAVEDNGGVYLVPAFVGLSAPYWRADVRAVISGLTPASTKYHIVRAGLESIAYIINDVLQLMRQEAGLNLQFIYADGGAVRNHFLMQFVTDITQIPVMVSSLPELSAFGAALNGMLGLGVYNSLGELKHLPLSYAIYEVKMDYEKARYLIEGWKRAVNQALSN